MKAEILLDQMCYKANMKNTNKILKLDTQIGKNSYSDYYKTSIGKVASRKFIYHTHLCIQQSSLFHM